MGKDKVEGMKGGKERWGGGSKREKIETGIITEGVKGRKLEKEETHYEENKYDVKIRVKRKYRKNIKRKI